MSIPINALQSSSACTCHVLLVLPAMISEYTSAVAFVYIDRFGTLVLRLRFLKVKTIIKVLLSLIPHIITIIITLPLVVYFIFGLVIDVMVFLFADVSHMRGRLV
jgi:hypothetical protein